MNAGGTDVLVDALELIEGRVTAALVGIRDRSPDATIVMVGYPQLVPEEGHCDLLPLTPDDYDYVRDLMAELGAATERAAAGGGGRVRRRAGRQRGSRHLRRRGRVGQRLGPADRAAAMHPFAEEQAAVAELVVEAFED